MSTFAYFYYHPQGLEPWYEVGFADDCGESEVVSVLCYFNTEAELTEYIHDTENLSRKKAQLKAEKLFRNMKEWELDCAGVTDCFSTTVDPWDAPGMSLDDFF